MSMDHFPVTLLIRTYLTTHSSKRVVRGFVTDEVVKTRPCCFVVKRVLEFTVSSVVKYTQQKTNAQEAVKKTLNVTLSELRSS